MFTGQNISTHKVRIPPAPGGFIDRIPDSLLMITEIFRDAGYATAGFTGSGFVGRAYAFDQGFEEFEESESHRTGEALDKALPWLERNAQRPFFLFLHGYDVHMFDPPRIYDDLGDDGYDGKLLELEGVAHIVNGDGFYEISDDDIRYLIHLYDNELREVDTQLARLFGFLEQSGLIRNTVVILTADHGQMFWENRHGGHSWDLYETLLRVPLAISAPGHRQQRKATDLVQTIDIAPTVLELTGLDEAAAHMQGTSLVPALRGARIGSRPLIAEADGYDTKASITLEGYKYIHNGIVSHNLLDPRFILLTLKALVTPYGTGEELFDMNEDPGELRNLAAARPELTAEYRALLFDTLRTLDAAGAIGDGKSAELTPDLEAQLRELGYIQ
jgi:arylsulfatase A-like enzyme